MTSHAESRLAQLLGHGVFAVTAEVVPPRSGDPDSVTHQARSVVGYADAVNVTDNPTASAHMSPLAGAAFVASAGLEPILQMTCRDRNRLGLESDLMGAWALGARNLLALTGDPAESGDEPDTAGVYDLQVQDLVRLAVALRDEGRLPSGREVESPPRYFIGAADSPLADGYGFERLEQKIEAGADFVQTQMVFDVDAFTAWTTRAAARGLLERVSILPGIGVVRSVKALEYVHDHLPGVLVPDAIFARMREAGEHAESEGIRVAVELVARLKAIPGIAGVHLMGMGNLEGVRRVVQGAGLLPRPALP